MIKNQPAKAGDVTCSFDAGVVRIPWRRKWQPTPVFLPGEPHGQKSLAGYSTRDCKELDVTEHAHTTLLIYT